MHIHSFTLTIYVHAHSSCTVMHDIVRAQVVVQGLLVQMEIKATKDLQDHQDPEEMLVQRDQMVHQEARAHLEIL